MVIILYFSAVFLNVIIALQYGTLVS